MKSSAANGKFNTNLRACSRNDTNGSHASRRANWLSLSIHRWFRKGNTAFGLNAEILAEAQDLALHSGQAAGPNVMYFETGQGSELSSEANFGADQVTMEARCYGLAKNLIRIL